MKRLRLWFWWLWNGRERLDLAWTRIEALERLTSEQNQIIVSLASEFNTLRNNLPAVLVNPPDPQQKIRRMGSWRATVAALEHRPEPPKEIRIERTS